MEYGRLYISEDKLNLPLRQNLEHHFEQMLLILGVDMSDLNFKHTPRRCARAWIKEFLIEPFQWSVFDEEPYGGAITLLSHEVWTRCPHHLERVRMEVSISYLPDGNRVLGLSKLARAADYYATGCILQESYTRLLAEGIMANLSPKGAAVHTKAYHNCMQARGVETGGPVLMELGLGCFEGESEEMSRFLRRVDRR